MQFLNKYQCYFVHTFGCAFLTTVFFMIPSPVYADNSLGVSNAQIEQLLKTDSKVRTKKYRYTNRHSKKRAKAPSRKQSKKQLKLLKSHKGIKISHRVTKKAKQMLRVPYRWGGTSPKGFDCSGLVQYTYKRVGVNLPRTAAEQFKATRRIKRKYTARGDLIFFHTRRSGRYVDHVGIYLGNGQFIHAPGRGKRVKISKLSRYWKRKMVGVGRTI